MDVEKNTKDVPLLPMNPALANEQRNTDRNVPGRDGANGKDLADGSAASFLPETDPMATIPGAPEGFNIYRNKKTLSQGLMDLALFSANANQLRFILDHNTNNTAAFFYIVFILILLSLVLQVGVGLLLLLSTQYNVTIECQRVMAYKYGNYVTAGIFLITVINVFIAAFGGSAVGNFDAGAIALRDGFNSTNSTNIR